VVRIASSAFVGRTVEMAALDEALEAAAQGHTTTVLIGGDAGVGKTRLLEAWNNRARERGARIAAGSCLDLGETGPAYTTVVEALRDLLRGLDPAEEETLVGPDRSVLARIVPELGNDPDRAAAGDQIPRLAQTRLFDRLVEVLQRAALHAPVVLELEDIHWADQSSRAFLVYLVEVSRKANLLLIGTYRPEAADTDQPFRSTLEQLLRRPRVATLPLEPFDREELREQLMGILGAPPSTALLTAIYARSEGNALFAEELAAAGDPSVDLPASVGDATANKVEGLSINARSVLRVASVVGRTASYDLLRSITSFGESKLADALREAVRARILEPGHVGETYRFRHALLQEAIYEETLPGERRRLHAAVAHALAEDPDQPRVDPDLAPRLAHHWYEARQFDRAFRASHAAATAADQQLAYAEALRHCERMLELWDLAAIARSDVTQAAIHQRAARSAFLAGDLETSASHGRQAVAELVDTPDASLKLRILDQLALTLLALGEDPGDVSRPVAEMELADRPTAERVVVLLHRSLVLRDDGEYDAALQMARPLPELARSVDDLALQARTTMLVADIVYMHDVDESLRTFRAARELASLSGDTVLVGDIDGTMCEVLLYAQRYEELLATTAAAAEFAERAGLGRLARPFLFFHRASAYLRLGMLADSLEAVRLAMTDEPTGQALVLLSLVAAQASIAIGAFDDAAAHLRAAHYPGATEDEELRRGYLATARAELAMAEDRFEDALRIVAATASRVAGADTYTAMSETTWWLAEVGLTAAAHRAERARAARDHQALDDMRDVALTLIAHVERVRRQRKAGGMGDIGTMHGHEALIAGHRARIEGRDEPALWVTAAEAFPPSSVEALTARYRQAEAMLAVRIPRDEIQAVMAEAHAAAVDIGAKPLAGRFEALARRARIDLRPAISGIPTEVTIVPAHEDASAPGAALRKRGLSDREIEVLALVAAGFSNGDIGKRLFITRKTAAVHVTHILDKLDVASRTEAATIGVRLGLPEIERDDAPR
jgi:DNA-binding NarL/FixJ family response regulator/tetratricopeptide (TPR) repeat protein